MSEYTSRYELEFIRADGIRISCDCCYDWKLSYSGEILICHLIDIGGHPNISYFDLSRYSEFVIRRVSDNVIVFSYGGKYL